MSVRSFIESVLYENYITRFGIKRTIGELKSAKAFIYYGEKRGILVLSKKVNERIIFAYLNVNGMEVRGIGDDEKECINKLALKIWA